MSSRTHYSSSPYPGLRPFEAEESDIFFGREEQTDELLDRLQSHHFLAVVGPSGCGKSSLVSAGMMAALKTGFMCDVGPDWHIVQIRPGERPLGNLSAALLKASSTGSERAVDPSAHLLLEAALRRGPLGLAEVAREAELCAKANLLIMVDQFEELFRFREKMDRNEADAFVSLLLATAAQRELPIFVVITMRSDYIGDCALFQGLPEAINAGQYLTPRLTREQCAEAICGPARVFGGNVDDKLLNRLLNDFGLDPNGLPVLQHALMRMWQVHTSLNTKDGVPPPIVLTLDDYESKLIGGLQHALSNHANEVLSELAPDQLRIAQIMFRRLTERRVGRSDTRFPSRMEEVAKLAGVSIEAVKPVVEAFRRTDRCFLTPREGEPLEGDRFLDIGHESLIRYWDTLSTWVDEEAELARVYARLKQTAAAWKREEAALWGSPDLDTALKWRRQVQPAGETWALRYGSGEEFQLAMDFLTSSEKEQQRRNEEAREGVRRKIRTARRAAIFAGAIASLAVVTLLGFFYFFVWDYEAYYVSFVKVLGAPKGIGELKSAQVKRRPVSLRIIRRGRIGPVLRMEAVNRNGKLTPQQFIGTYLNEGEKGQSPSKEARWEFTYDRNRRVTQETAFDLQGNRLWGFVYLPQRGIGERVRTGYYVGRDGYPRAETQYSGNVVEIEYDDEGYEVALRYRSRGLRPVRGPDKAFGRRQIHDRQGREIAIISLDPNDKPLNDEFGNAIFRVTRMDTLGNVEESVTQDAFGKITVIKEGWAIRRNKYDGAGNVIEESYFDPSGAQTSSIDGYHKVTWKRDEHGNPVELRYLNAQGWPTPGQGGCFGWVLQYDDLDNPVKQICLGSDDKPAFYEQGYAIWGRQYDENRNVLEEQYFDPAGKPILSSFGYAKVRFRFDKLGNVLEIAYFSTDGSPVVSLDGCSRITRQYDKQGRLVRGTYWGIDGKPVLTKDGYAAFEYEYDSFGNIIRMKYFDDRGEPTIGSEEGVAGWTARYDAAGREIELSYIDPKGKPMYSNQGIAGFRQEYDEAGNEIKYSYIGLGGAFAPMDGIAGWNSQFDLLGNETERRYFNLSGKPVGHKKDGTAGWKIKYDQRGNKLDFRYLDIHGNLTMAPWTDEDFNEPIYPGRALEAFTYNDQNLLTEQTYFGTQGELVTRPEGYARAAHEYDLRGNRVKTRYYGSDNQPINIHRGFHSVERLYDDRRQVTDIRYFSTNGDPVSASDGYARITKSFDRYERLTEERVFDPRGLPTVTNEGWYRRVRQYDPRGRLIEVADFGPNNQPIINRLSYQMVRYSYDQRGKISEELFLSGPDKPALVKGGYSRRTLAYNARLQLVETGFFDQGGKNMGHWLISYDSKGRETKRIFLDASGKPIQ
jgi:hypothetical protein